MVLVLASTRVSMPSGVAMRSLELPMDGWHATTRRSRSRYTSGVRRSRGRGCIDRLSPLPSTDQVSVAVDIGADLPQEHLPNEEQALWFPSLQ
jgi:hypothetical protein